MVTVVLGYKKPLIKKVLGSYKIVVDPQQFGYPAYYPGAQTKFQAKLDEECVVTREPSVAEAVILSRSLHNWTDVEWKGWKLAGSKVVESDCASWHFKGCLNNWHPAHKDQDYIEKHQNFCYELKCKICLWPAISKRSNKITRRLGHYMKKSGKKLSHVIISVPKLDMDLDEKKIKQKVLRKLRKVGLTGGLIAIHPFRVEWNDKEEYQQGDWYSSLHYHCIVAGWVEGTKEEYKKSGYVIKKIRTLYNEKDIYGCARYFLSHVGVKEGRHSFSWYGNLSYKKLTVSVTKENDSEISKCPYCNSKLRRLMLKQEDRGPPAGENYFGRWKKGVFMLKVVDEIG
jgi:hypothetical protein